MPRAPTARQVTLYTAPGCSLCTRALEVIRAAQGELGFSLEVVDISGDLALEARYRESLPAVEIDGRPAFTYFVEPAALRRALAVPPAQPEEPLAES